MTLVDTNVLLDLATDDPQWAEWSIGQLETASLTGPLLINEVIYAELAVRYERIEDLDHFIEAAGLQMASLPREALFLAGKVFTQYRRAGARELVFCPIFHWRACSSSANTTVDARCRTLPNIFSDGCADYSQLIVNGAIIGPLALWLHGKHRSGYDDGQIPNSSTGWQQSQRT